MVPLSELAACLERLLECGRFTDYAPNGLQVEGRAEVRRLAGGVSASRELIAQALAWGADAIVVHHGWFWRNEDPCVRGMQRQRLRALLCADMSLLAYHLPLDAHAELGNNVQLARVLDIEVTGALETAPGEPALLLRGRLSAPMSGEELGHHIARCLARAPLHITAGPALIRDVAWCTGAAQDYLLRAAAAGVDAFITGEAPSAPRIRRARAACTSMQRDITRRNVTACRRCSRIWARASISRRASSTSIIPSRIRRARAPLPAEITYHIWGSSRSEIVMHEWRAASRVRSMRAAGA
jgi:dinuclear metal center YbgI/SA1388 family protein